MDKKIGFESWLLVGLFVVFIVVTIFFLFLHKWFFLIESGVILVFFVSGLRIAHEEERFVVEFLGSFWEIKGPGLIWIFPLLMRIRAIVSVWEQTLILFSQPIKVDFKDGSATPKGVRALVRIKNPDTPYSIPGELTKKTGCYRAIYEVDNWRKKSIELIENATRSYLATLTIDEVLPERKGGYDLLDNRIPDNEKERIKNTIEKWGISLLNVYITDFDLDESIIKARENVQKKKRESEVAEQEKIIRARETIGSLIQMFAEFTGRKYEEVQGEIKNSPELKEMLSDFARELITRRMSIDGGSLTDIRVNGAKGVEKSLLNLLSLYKK